MLKFVDFGDFSINPHQVASVTESGDYVYVFTVDRRTFQIAKYKGEIIYNNRKAVVSALELATQDDQE